MINIKLIIVWYYCDNSIFDFFIGSTFADIKCVSFPQIIILSNGQLNGSMLRISIY